MPDSFHSDGRRRRVLWRFVALSGVAVLVACRAMRRWKFGMRRTRGAETQRILRGSEEHREERSKIAFEPTDWDPRPVALVYAGSLVLLVVSAFVVMAGYPTALPDVRRNRLVAPPGPGLQTNPESDLQRLRADEERKLNTYYWIDKQKGIVRIPIAQAMKKLADTGIPGFPKARQ